VVNISVYFPRPAGQFFFLDPSLLPYFPLATSINLASVVIMCEKSRSKTVGIMIVNHVTMTTGSHGESNRKKRKTFRHGCTCNGIV
jgi:hypothetical protein